ncbi:MAG: spermidine synthase [Campylobacterota bacterium]|nr:spermidine synthase [Campylobacterota bacterium]
MKEFIYPEMMLHVPMCTSKNPQNILIISDSAELIAKETLKYNEITTTAIECSLDAVSKLKDTNFDVVICEMDADAILIAQLNRIVKEDAQVAMVHPSLDEVEANKTIISSLGKFFKIVMPYNLGDGSTALLASKEYHPTADIILQRSDMIDGNNFYNCDVHLGAFAMPNYIRKEYLGIIKN